MRIGVFTAALGSMRFEQALDYLASEGVQAVEIGVGAYPQSPHCPVDELLASRRKRSDFMHLVSSRGMVISSLSCHGNPVHPNKQVAREHHTAFCKAVRLAHRLGVEVVTTFSGCPAGAPGDKRPNWVTCAWPPDYPQMLDYQWNKVVIPYWARAVEFAHRQGLSKVAIEMHPGFVVYNPDTLLRLRKAVGPCVGVNFDPSHLFWQGIDPCAAVRALKGAIWHVHAKDLAFEPPNHRRNGVLETKPSHEVTSRAWIFRTVGHGHPRQFWCDLLASLRMAGYNGTLSLEHEDPLMSPREGLEKGIRFLQSIILE